MSARWVLCPVDHRNHVLPDQASHGLIGGVLARCGHRLPATVEPTDIPAAGGAVCTHCAAELVNDAIGPPVHYAPRLTRQAGT